jgi:hypothetical protein
LLDARQISETRPMRIRLISVDKAPKCNAAADNEIGFITVPDLSRPFAPVLQPEGSGARWKPRQVAYNKL